MTSHVLAPARAFIKVARAPFFNVSYRKVGGLHFVKVGRFCMAFCVTKGFRP